MSDEARIAELTQAMSFSRKSAATPREKAAYAALSASCGEAARMLNQLNLRLWHACEGHYRSLPLPEARAMLEDARRKIDAALEKCPPGADS
jgi:hypothetical protein